MGCDEFAESLTASMDGELSPREAADLEDHLEQCDRCRQEHESLAYAHWIGNSLPQLEARPESWERIRSHVTPRPVASPLPALVRWLPLAAALLVAVFLSLYFVSESDVEARQLLDEYVQQREKAETHHAAPAIQPGQSDAARFATFEIEEAYPNPFADHSHQDNDNPFRLE